MTKVCARCRGQKKVSGMGWIERTCDECSGSGYVPRETRTTHISDDYPASVSFDCTSPTPSAISKQRGRPRHDKAQRS